METTEQKYARLKAKIPKAVYAIMGLDDARFDGRYKVTRGVIETDERTAHAIAEEAQARANGTGQWAESENYTPTQRRALLIFAKRLCA